MDLQARLRHRLKKSHDSSYKRRSDYPVLPKRRHPDLARPRRSGGRRKRFTMIRQPSELEMETSGACRLAEFWARRSAVGFSASQRVMTCSTSQTRVDPEPDQVRVNIGRHKPQTETLLMARENAYSGSSARRSMIVQSVDGHGGRCWPTHASSQDFPPLAGLGHEGATARADRWAPSPY